MLHAQAAWNLTAMGHMNLPPVSTRGKIRATMRTTGRATAWGGAMLAAEVRHKLINKFFNWLDQVGKKPEPERRCNANPDSLFEVEYFDTSRNEWLPDDSYAMRKQSWMNEQMRRDWGTAASGDTYEQNAAKYLQKAEMSGWLNCPRPFPPSPK